MPDEELKQLLKKNLEISEESLRILKKMNRAAVIGRILRFFKWMIIIGISVGAFYYIEPYIGQLADLLKQLQKFQNILP
ncbi:MAG: hypothetical protein HY773_02645 [Candidatus Terrybacteria bacterium]|nr:hypothetical protein [Candidatus Terrybacteria bacterium]